MSISDFDPLVAVNEKLRIISDSYQLLINQLNTLLNGIINQTEKKSETRKDHCEICLVKSVKLQGHHIAGRYNDFRQITVCTGCHDALTAKQHLDARVWMKNNPDFLKMAFFLRGLYDVLILMAEKKNNTLYAQIAHTLTPTIYALQRSAQN
ncbi:MAG: HNH endonuclease [Candidatus Nitrosotenuis sp.]